MSSRLRIIVSGLIGLYPIGGVAWDYLQYVIGLARLGHDVYYHENTGCWPYHPVKNVAVDEPSYTVRYLVELFKRSLPDLNARWHYKHLNRTHYGMSQYKFEQVVKDADVFLNVSGCCIIPEGIPSSCVKIFVDTDPGYNQIMLRERFEWSENVERWCESVAAHDRHFTYGENILGPDCSIPSTAFEWTATRMPVVLNLWQPLARTRVSARAPWSTVMTWNAFKGRLRYDGTEYLSKGSEFEKIADLPSIVATPLRVAVGGDNAPRQWLARKGWQVIHGPSATRTPLQYQAFIGESCGEVSAAKHVYVETRSGWFSCRSACYLAAGRPVVLQDTGFSVVLPVGEGILPFRTVQEAAAAIMEVEGDYPRHAAAAQAVAAEYFNSDRILTRLLEEAIN